MTTSQMIADFTTLAIQTGGWMELDRLYLQNRLLSMIGEQELGEVDIRPVATPAADLTEQLCQIASANQLVKTEQQKEQFMVQLMDLLTPPPSVVNAFFAQHYAKEPQEATEYFYQLCQKNGTVIEQEEPVVFSTVYGDFLANNDGQKIGESVKPRHVKETCPAWQQKATREVSNFLRLRTIE